MTNHKAHLIGIYVFSSNLDASVRFYRALGLDVEVVGDMLARASWGSGVMLEIGADMLTRSYDPGWQREGGPSKVTINLELESRKAVDERYGLLHEAGYSGHLAPIDAQWGARFAIIEDPDGNYIGMHSPRDRDAERQAEQAAQQ